MFAVGANRSISMQQLAGYPNFWADLKTFPMNFRSFLLLSLQIKHSTRNFDDASSLAPSNDGNEQCQQQHETIINHTMVNRKVTQMRHETAKKRKSESTGILYPVNVTPQRVLVTRWMHFIDPDRVRVMTRLHPASRRAISCWGLIRDQQFTQLPPTCALFLWVKPS